MSKKNSLDIDNKNIKKPWWKIVTRIIFGSTIPQRLFRGYLFLIVVGSVLLFLPISLQSKGIMQTSDDSKSYSFWDAMFVACSAITDTGLTPVIVSSTYTIFGQIVILLLIEIGGLGLITVIFLIWHMLKPKKSIDLNQLIMLQSEKGNEKIGGTYKTLKISVIFILCSQLFFAFLMSFWICFMPLYTQINIDGVTHTSDNVLYSLSWDTQTPINAHHHYGLALWQGLFTAVSSMNNAGFDIFEKGFSIASFRNDWNVIFQLMVMIEIIIGGIGFPLIYDVIQKNNCKRKGVKYKVTLFTKVALTGYIAVFIVGIASAYGFEYGYPSNIVNSGGLKDIVHYACSNQEFGKNEQFNKAWCVLFNTVSTRSAGFATVNQTLFAPGTQWTYIIQMFIGGSPSSTGGGIRTTTIVIVVWTIISKVIGRERVAMFKRNIPTENIRDSLLVTVVGFALIVFCSIIIFYCSPNNSGDTLIQSLYETTSAFGTVGFSMGFTSNVNAVGEVILILIMFVGQLGISGTLLAWTKKNPRGNLVEYPTESVKIG
ncbi:MAG: hypothetical protein LBL60_00135 [Mycoplasmataceae bacterium]|nr:hypothetical protein [Mycoplasmataceae bacterium]